METVTTYSMLGHLNERREISSALLVAPGLFVFRLPDSHRPSNPCRWRIGHHSGHNLADAMRREDAIRGAEFLATVSDWTQDVETLRASIDPVDLFAKLSFRDCVEPGSERMTGDVSRNGTYTDADIAEAAEASKADGMSAYDILLAMSHTVPWMGLDTNEFNEAHDRIVTLAGAE